MKALLAAMGSAFLSAIDPGGCSATAGSDVANGPDAATPATVVTATSCTNSTHAFCDDFEGVTIPSRFDAEDLLAGSTKIDLTRSVSAPYSLLATTERVTTGTRTNGRLRKDFAQTGNVFTLGYDEYVDSACIGAGDNVETGVIGVRDNSYWIAVRHAAGGDTVLESGLAANSIVEAHVLRQPLPRNAWTRIELTVDFTKNTIDLAADGQAIVVAEPLKEPPAGPFSSRIEVGVLVDNTAQPPTPCNVGIDDVTFDIH